MSCKSRLPVPASTASGKAKVPPERCERRASYQTNTLPTNTLWTEWQEQSSIQWVKRLDEDPEAASAAFGNRIRELRAEHGVSQDDLARETDVHPTAIGRMERGAREPRLTTILRIARGLDVKPGELLDELERARR